jgi:hypothetical protein
MLMKVLKTSKYEGKVLRTLQYADDLVLMVKEEAML